MKLKVMNGDTGSCASDCEFKAGIWCNLFCTELFGYVDNPTRFTSCIMITDIDAEFSSLRFEIDKLSKCFGCQRYRKGFPNNCTAGSMCKDGNLNSYRS